MQNIQKLYDLEQKTSLGSNAVLLFLFLKEIKNEDSQITISDYDLAKILRLARQTIITAKKTLKESGWIDYYSNKGETTTYILLNSTANLHLSKVTDSTSIKNCSDPKTENKGYPSWEEFFNYVQTLQNYHQNLEPSLKEKYEVWVANNWKNAFGKPILNWKRTIENNIAFLNTKVV